MRRRLIRIVPLYWTALTLRVLVLTAGVLLGAKTFPYGTAIITSYLFIPYNAMGFGPRYPFPILDLGWTLNYEMFFTSCSRCSWFCGGRLSLRSFPASWAASCWRRSFRRSMLPCTSGFSRSRWNSPSGRDDRPVFHSRRRDILRHAHCDDLGGSAAMAGAGFLVRRHVGPGFTAGRGWRSGALARR